MLADEVIHGRFSCFSHCGEWFEQSFCIPRFGLSSSILILGQLLSLLHMISVI